MDERSVRDIMADAPPDAPKLLALIARQARRGPIHPKPAGVATPPEVLEACGLDVGHFYDLLRWLAEHGVIQMEGDYPFEEIRLTPAAVAEFGGAGPPP